MRSRWSDDDAREFIARYAGEWGEALALRTYTSRLLGAEPELVLHGGGNSSVKVTRRTLLGDTVPVIHVKGSGVDMASIGPEGHPGVDLNHLARLRALPSLNDEEMVNELRTHLVRADSPTPSIETLVHAFLPATFIDHTHADAILALTNQAGGDTLVAEALGSQVPVLEYVTPGFDLARRAADDARCESRGERDGVVSPRHRHLGRHRARGIRDHDRDGHAGGAFPGFAVATACGQRPAGRAGDGPRAPGRSGASPSRPAGLAIRRSRSALAAGRPSGALRRCDARGARGRRGRRVAGHPAAHVRPPDPGRAPARLGASPGVGPGRSAPIATDVGRVLLRRVVPGLSRPARRRAAGGRDAVRRTAARGPAARARRHLRGRRRAGRLRRG